ncbi:MAG TPA: thiamine phosphate synthase [Thermoanaerobaculia bacterium]|nr:thiamine phosphate synthase [Thermoanaerobaculia bacterium]
MGSIRIPGRIYAIADAEALGSIPLPEAVGAMAAAGIGWIQVRAKRLSGRDLFRVLDECCRVVEGTGTALWMDDRADLAALFPVAGVHVGQADLPPAAVRRVLGDRLWIGLSTHDEAQLAAADADPDVDVVAVGPVFPTASKERPDPVVGLDFVRRARARTAKPLVAIGGIGAETLRAVLEAGADAAVVLGAVCRGSDLGQISKNARRLLSLAG